MIPGFRRSSAGKSGDEQRRTRRLTTFPVGVPAATTVAVPCAGVAVRAAARQQQCRHVNLCFPDGNGEPTMATRRFSGEPPGPRSIGLGQLFAKSPSSTTSSPPRIATPALAPVASIESCRVTRSNRSGSCVEASASPTRASSGRTSRGGPLGLRALSGQRIETAAAGPTSMRSRLGASTWATVAAWSTSSEFRGITATTRPIDFRSRRHARSG